MTESEHYIPPELPEDSVLSLSEYLDMFAAVSHELRYRLLRTLLETGQLSARQIGEHVDAPSNKLHYHLDKLEAAGLVANRKRNEHDSEGLYSYYVPTSLGEIVMEGVGNLLEEERERRCESDEESEHPDSSGRVRPHSRLEGDASKT
jgi:DNA-binding MarR family transcriptional regulator